MLATFFTKSVKFEVSPNHEDDEGDSSKLHDLVFLSSDSYYAKKRKADIKTDHGTIRSYLGTWKTLIVCPSKACPYTFSIAFIARGLQRQVDCIKSSLVPMRTLREACSPLGS